ncbi:kielin/chordin-like protein [Gordionus sp. m RMFG-2023]|uniref:kielin/chordin-like protein n=1 Tax=Gordionus sp. m RMFG-2023 TaxID=3053472 RepID=UPI0031FBA65E
MVSLKRRYYFLNNICPPGVPISQCKVNPCEVTKCPLYPNAECRPFYCGGCFAIFYVDDAKHLCPPDKPVVNCLVDPCQLSKCPTHPNAECRANYCGGCNADFYLYGKKVSCESENSKCPPPKHIFNCFVDPCQFAKCQAYPSAECRSNYCGGCNADFYLNNKKVSCLKSVCPPDKPIVNCLVDPCQFAKCPANPKAECRSNYCGGCNADFYLNNEKISCEKELLCPPDKPIVNCLVDPCQFAKCPMNPKADCRSNYCGGCNANFYLNEQKVSCEKESLCPPDIPIVNCLVNPCKFAKCPASPKAVCRSNYCGGCNADFYLNEEKVSCENSLCPPDKPIVNCLVDPCKFAKCPANPKAKCRSNFCGGCNADFYLNNKKISCSNLVCPLDKPMVYCYVEPCQFAKCPAYPKAECRSNYCGGCHADFYLYKEKVSCSETNGKCPPDKPKVNCLVDPCKIAKCPSNPQAICKANYCGGCNAEFYENDKPIICHECPPGHPIVMCYANPCKLTTCPAYPNAICKPYICETCEARYYVNEIRVRCDKKCSPTEPIVNCLINPCKFAVCPAFPDAICTTSNCASCKAEFYLNETLVDCEKKCPLHKPRVECLVNPCDGKIIKKYPNAICVPNYCGGCDAVFYNEGKKIKKY